MPGTPRLDGQTVDDQHLYGVGAVLGRGDDDSRGRSTHLGTPTAWAVNVDLLAQRDVHGGQRRAIDDDAGLRRDESCRPAVDNVAVCGTDLVSVRGDEGQRTALAASQQNRLVDGPVDPNHRLLGCSARGVARRRHGDRSFSGAGGVAILRHLRCSRPVDAARGTAPDDFRTREPRNEHLERAGRRDYELGRLHDRAFHVHPDSHDSRTGHLEQKDAGRPGVAGQASDQRAVVDAHCRDRDVWHEPTGRFDTHGCDHLSLLARVDGTDADLQDVWSGESPGLVDHGDCVVVDVGRNVCPVPGGPVGCDAWIGQRFERRRNSRHLAQVAGGTTVLADDPCGLLADGTALPGNAAVRPKGLG